MTTLLDRLNRWAENLPSTESIPISDAEALELAVFIGKTMYSDHSDPSMDASTFTSILAGKFAFAGHKVVVL